MTPGKRLKQVRDILKLTQTQLGEHFGFKGTKIKDIEIGKQKLTPEIALEIEKKFSISFEWLLNGRGDITTNQVHQTTGYNNYEKALDPITAKITVMLTDMSEEQRRDILRYTEERKLLAEMAADKKRMVG